MTTEQIRIKQLEAKMLEMADNFILLQKAVETVAKQAEAKEAPLQEILDIFNSLKGGFKVIGWLGAIAKWVSVVAAGAAAAWAYWHKVLDR